MVTKCDLVSGFVETFGDLKDRERGQIWGFTLPVASEHATTSTPSRSTSTIWPTMLERDAVGGWARSGARGPRPDLRLSAAVRFAAPGPVDLIASLFVESVYQDAPIMRGVYFTSGTQEGRPIDRIMAAWPRPSGCAHRCCRAPVTKPKSYFVRDMFRQVVFPDAEVAVRSSRVLRRERLARWGVAIAALAISAAFLFFPISSYLKNSALVEEARRFVDKLAGNKRDRAHGLAAETLESVDPDRRAPHGAGDHRSRGLSPVRPLSRRPAARSRAPGRRAGGHRPAAGDRAGPPARLLAWPGRDQRIERPERPLAPPAHDPAQGGRRAGARGGELARQMGRGRRHTSRRAMERPRRGRHQHARPTRRREPGAFLLRHGDLVGRFGRAQESAHFARSLHAADRTPGRSAGRSAARPRVAP